MEFKGGAGIISWPWGGGQGCVFQLPVFLTAGGPPSRHPAPPYLWDICIPGWALQAWMWVHFSRTQTWKFLSFLQPATILCRTLFVVSHPVVQWMFLQVVAPWRSAPSSSAGPLPSMASAIWVKINRRPRTASVESKGCVGSLHTVPGSIRQGCSPSMTGQHCPAVYRLPTEGFGYHLSCFF